MAQSSTGSGPVGELWTERPQLILYNANVITCSPSSQPRARALAVVRDRILAIGDDDGVRDLASAGTRQIDLEGRTVVPGFNDAHCHLNWGGLMHLRGVPCSLPSIAAIRAALHSRAEQTPPGEWVQGFNYDDGKTAERCFLSRDDLDAAVPGHPVFVLHIAGHTAYVNSRALERAGISEGSDDPPGGRLERDPATGRLTGRVCETAMDLFTALIPSEFTRAENQAAATLVTGMMVRAGITSVHDLWATSDDLLAYQDAHQAGELPLRVYCMIHPQHFEKMLEAGLRTGFGDEWVRMGGLKLLCDGAIAEHTAWLSQPYAGRQDDHGIQTMGEEELYRTAQRAHRAGWQIGVHANGDRAIDLVLRTYERLQREDPRPDPRFRLEHCTVLDLELIRRIKALNAVPTPLSAHLYYYSEKLAEYGADRIEWMFALRSLIDAGVMVAPGSDYPSAPFEPMMALQAAVTRADLTGRLWGPSQRITVDEALRVGTLNGAYASFEEELKGSLEPGKLVDLVVLGADPAATEPEALGQIAVERTMVGGKWVFEA